MNSKIPEPKTWLIWPISVIAIIANLTDAISTYLSLSSGKGYEVNNFMAPLYENFPIWGYFLKILLGSYIVWVGRYSIYQLIKPPYKWMMLIVYIFLIILLLKVSWGNFILSV